MAPIIYRGTADTGIPARSDNGWGQGVLGDVSAVTFHHSAGPRAKDKAQCIKLNKAYDAQHQAQGWGGIGYHWIMDDQGRLYQARPSDLRGAHTGGHNTGNIGIMIHGSYDHDRLTLKQRETIKWMFQGGFVVLTGERERDIALVRGHQEWSGPTNQTACPGANLMRHLRWRRQRDLH